MKKLIIFLLLGCFGAAAAINDPAFQQAGGKVISHLQPKERPLDLSCDPFIIVDPDFIFQTGNYFLNCYPAVTTRIYAGNLTENLIVTGVCPYEDGMVYLSLSNKFDYSNSLEITPHNGQIDTILYIRFCPGWFDRHALIYFNSSGCSASADIIVDGEAGNAPVSTLGNILAEPGSSVIVQLRVKDYNYIYQAHYFIGYNPSVLTFTGLGAYIGWFTSAWATVISPDSAFLEILFECPIDVYMECPDYEKLAELCFDYAGGATALTFRDCSFINVYQLVPIDEPASDYYINGSVGPSVRKLQVKVLPEGLYDPVSDSLNPAMGSNGPVYPEDVSDQITLALHSVMPCHTGIFSADSVFMDRTGIASINVPVEFSNNHYLTARHRNSIETWSAQPVSFADCMVNYDFSLAQSQAYGNNLKAAGNRFVIFSGDINQDGITDPDDMTLIYNAASVFASGYLVSDLNGDGQTDTWDMNILDNNAAGFRQKVIPCSTQLPVSITDSVLVVDGISAVAYGKVTKAGTSPVTERGFCWHTGSEPKANGLHYNSGNGSGTFSGMITGLNYNTKYFIRSYGINNEGAAYGNQLIFTTTLYSQGNGLTDTDGNYYNTVIIGTQEWMAENLSTMSYCNGESITNITSNDLWNNTRSGAYCWYNNEISYGEIYGALYNWYAVADDRKLCPAGWHVPDQNDWAVLRSLYLDWHITAGEMMKAEYGWVTGNGNNLSGFLALPGGERGISGNTPFLHEGSMTKFWCSSEYLIGHGFYLNLDQGPAAPMAERSGNFGHSVRCIKD